MRVSRLTIDNLHLAFDKAKSFFSGIPYVTRAGQSLIEVVVAMAVIVGLAVALVTTTLVVQKASRTSKNNSQATKLVQQNIEQVRIFRDRKGFDALSIGSCWFLDTSQNDPKDWSLKNAPGDCPHPILQTNVTFNRSIEISCPPAPGDCSSQKTIKVIVTWTDSGGIQSVSNQTILSAGM